MEALTSSRSDLFSPSNSISASLGCSSTTMRTNTPSPATSSATISTSENWARV